MPFDKETLLKIKREFTENEAVAVLRKTISELEIEIGKLKSELAEKDHRLKKYEKGEGKPAKEWLKDDYINDIKKRLKQSEKTIKHLHKVVEEWTQKYLALLKTSGKS